MGRLIPLVGDVILATFKANSRNAALLEEYLRIRGEEYLKVRQGSDSFHMTGLNYCELS